MEKIKTFEDLLNYLKGKAAKTVAVAVAQDEDVLKAVNNACQLGIIKAILVGEQAEIEKTARGIGIDLGKFFIIDVPDKTAACRKAVELVHLSKADLLMKGFVDTSVLLKAVLDKNIGFKGRLLSHVGVLKVLGFDRLFILTDSAMNIAPTLEEKAEMIRNAVEVAHALGNPNPKVAVLCAVEKVNPKMPATIDAHELTQMNERGEISGCMVKGPFALDNAVSLESARHKGLDHPVAGQADILVTPDIEAGNMLNKAMEYFGRAEKAGVIMGASTPIILTSRASSDQSKLNSIAVAFLIADKLN